MKRRNGFSLVELLIVLAVIAALIAVVTPIALNAIAKAKATQVAENIKLISSSFENTGYVDGVSSLSTTLSDFVRDADATQYAIAYGNDSGTVTATVTYSGGNVNFDLLDGILSGVATTTGTDIIYVFDFTVY